MANMAVKLTLFYSFPTLSYAFILSVVAAITGYILWEKVKKSKLFIAGAICVGVGVVLFLVQRYTSFLIWRKDLYRLLYTSSPLSLREHANVSVLLGSVLASCTGCALFMVVLIKNHALEFKKKTITETILFFAFVVLAGVIVMSFMLLNDKSYIFSFFDNIRRQTKGKKASSAAFKKQIIFFLCDVIPTEWSGNRLSKDMSEFFINQWNNTFSDSFTSSLYNHQFRETCPQGSQGVGKRPPTIQT